MSLNCCIVDVDLKAADELAGTGVIVKTHDRQYEVAGSLEKMQARLPIQLERVSWGILVAPLSPIVLPDA